MNPTFDDRDQGILDERRRNWNHHTGPRVGDFARLLDGTTRRFCHDWGDKIQITPAKESGSFYLGNGFADYSGGLEPSMPKTEFKQMGVPQDGRFWFFHHDERFAHNGVYFKIPCRVFVQTREATA